MLAVGYLGRHRKCGSGKHFFRLDGNEFVRRKGHTAAVKVQAHGISDALPAGNVQALPAAKHRVIRLRHRNQACEQDGEDKGAHCRSIGCRSVSYVEHESAPRVLLHCP